MACAVNMKNLIATVATDELASAERALFKIAAQLVILTLQSVAIAASFAFRYHRGFHRLEMLPTVSAPRNIYYRVAHAHSRPSQKAQTFSVEIEMSKLRTGIA